MDTTTTDGATGGQEERTWCRSASALDEELHFYVHRPTEGRAAYALSLHVGGVSSVCHPSEALLRELHRVIGDALFGEPDEWDATEETT